ncbi:MAG: formylglycine-generating enzyme family protein [Nitrospirae bacterium]|nr:formylglycine-generating enzyme family protein [Nitrospirota bacterium]
MVLFFSGCSIAGKEVKAPLPPEDMVYVPAGWFLMGSTEKDGRLGQSVGVDELPQHKVYLKGFYIDRYEVTVGDYKFFLKQTNRVAPRIWTKGEWVKMYPSPEDNHPMNGVTWYDADEYCRWKGKRLPTEAEWEKSARGTDGRQWPWGNEPDSMEQPRANTLDKGIGWTTPVGSYPAGVSPYGVHDMAGNVMEWTSSWYEAYPGSTLKRDEFGQRYKVLKGGSWENHIVPYARSAYRHTVTPKWDHPGHGFRCAMDE